ncbi:MAG: short chain dehydrogenase [Betaproteobacteria bacterium HGW-Betaproteobacteria-12]|nr:MAG: short chain dehydrogenase [Betaproteobacteria bacterium HGW-Betaproteobacteria-12]
MQLNQARILLTGANGGLGQALARQLSAAGAALLLTGREGDRLAGLVPDPGGEVSCLQADLTDADDLARIVEAARAFGVNVLINSAGIGCFGLLEEQAWPNIERVLLTNLEMPMRLTHALLPWLTAQPQAVIVNIGSTFGSLPFPGFAAYSAAKAGLRGFSQALRRELADSAVSVVHLAPRAIDTPLNSPAVNALNRQLGNRSDNPEDVASQVVQALLREDRERHFGFPERLFAWLNGVAPRLIDQALAGKLATIKKHASSL